MSITVNGTNGLTFNDASTQNTAATGFGFKNRIINGDMRIDQRNAGGSVTPTTGGTYTLDRWVTNATQSSKYSLQQNAGSVTPPSGFASYLGVTSLSAYSLTGNDTFSVEQTIEGFNVADLAWGTASASPVALSFWVRSSLTGTFGGSIATTKTAVWVMPFSYTISSANTWTYVTVAVTAPTATGGANTGNTQGVYVRFSLGATGTTVGGTAGVWTNAGNFVAPAGAVSVVGTSGATFYITGVQLEKGSTATSFDYRPYGTELALCQRYYQINLEVSGPGAGASTSGSLLNIPFFVSMRATAACTATLTSGTAATFFPRFDGVTVALTANSSNQVALTNVKNSAEL
jgi:hypothetical protein